MLIARWQKGVIAVVAACALNLVGDRILGVRIELFWGLSSFNLSWFIDMFILPFFVGLTAALIFGMGGKWLCYFPPLIVRILSYLEVLYISGIPEGASLLPLGWWGLFVIVVMEVSAFGGIAGEILNKKTYGRLPRAQVYKDKLKPEENDNSN